MTQNLQKNTCDRSLSNTVEALHAVRLATLIKEKPRTSVLKPAVRKFSLK